jgi:hypothetical protein
VIDTYTQNFTENAEATHVSWLMNAKAFANGGYSGDDLTNANIAEAGMGY